MADTSMDRAPPVVIDDDDEMGDDEMGEDPPTTPGVWAELFGPEQALQAPVTPFQGPLPAPLPAPFPVQPWKSMHYVDVRNHTWRLCTMNKDEIVAIAVYYMFVCNWPRDGVTGSYHFHAAYEHENSMTIFSMHSQPILKLNGVKPSTKVGDMPPTVLQKVIEDVAKALDSITHEQVPHESIANHSDVVQRAKRVRMPDPPDQEKRDAGWKQGMNWDPSIIYKEDGQLYDMYEYIHDFQESKVSWTFREKSSWSDGFRVGVSDHNMLVKSVYDKAASAEDFYKRCKRMKKAMRDLVSTYSEDGWKDKACDVLNGFIDSCTDIVLSSPTLLTLLKVPSFRKDQADDEFKNLLFNMKTGLGVVQERALHVHKELATIVYAIEHDDNMAKMYQVLITGGVLARAGSVPLSAFMPVPDCFKCPISLQPFKNPVTLRADGKVYEKEALDEWLSRRMTSPVTRAPVPNIHPYYDTNYSMLNAMRAHESILEL